MPVVLKTIEVVPNPYIAIDADGVPQGVVGAGAPGAFIGAQLDLVETRRTGKNRFYFPKAKDGSLKRTVPFTADIAHAIRVGDLLAADKKTALICGISEKEFKDPEKQLEAERQKAQAYLESLYGKGAAEVKPIPREATQVKEGETLPTETASKQLTASVKKEG